MPRIAYVFLLLIVAGCNDRLFIPSNYSPDNPIATVGAVETAEIDVFVENLDITNKHMIYDLEVINKSEFPVLVDPHDIFYYGSYDAFAPLAPGEEVHASFGQAAEGAREVFALKEERVNNDIRATIKSREAVAFVLVLAATALVVNDVVQDSQDFSKEVWTSADARRSNARDVATFAGLLTLDLVQAGMEAEQMKEFADLEYLPQEYLHEQILSPGESIRGKVFLPRRDIEHIRLVVPIASRDYIFDFRQAKTKEMRLIKAARR